MPFRKLIPPFTLTALKLVTTKGYGVQATTIEGQNAFAPLVARNYGEGEWTHKIYY